MGWNCALVLTVSISGFIGLFDAGKTERVVMIATQYFGSENIASVLPRSGLVLHFDPRESATITRHILTFNQTAAPRTGGNKEAWEVTNSQKLRVRVSRQRWRRGSRVGTRGEQRGKKISVDTVTCADTFKYLLWYIELYTSCDSNCHHPFQINVSSSDKEKAAKV